MLLSNVLKALNSIKKHNNFPQPIRNLDIYGHSLFHPSIFQVILGWLQDAVYNGVLLIKRYEAVTKCCLMLSDYGQNGAGEYNAVPMDVLDPGNWKYVEWLYD
jgi:hypothetical protein